MKLKGNATIASEVGTYIGTLTWIDWEHNRGKVLLDAPPGEDPVEVDCAFRYAGQHWIWNMDAYPEEDIASHSAFAFCMGDRVMLVHPAPPQEIKDEQSGQMVPDPESPKHVAVAVLKEEDDGQGGKTATLEKRKVWPLYRLGHEAVVLNIKYAGLDGKGAGFPFVSEDGRREYVNPYYDQLWNVRAFGTPEKDGGYGNTRLVVTRETNERGETRFIPHAIHEFCEPGEDIPYVPDALMQTVPNWRGRIVGWSAEDEILIDNIPVAKVTGAADIEETIVPSWKAVTRKFVHLDEERNVVTALFVTMDCNFDWRPREKSGNPSGGEAVYWYPPLYAFYVQRGSVQLDELCVYAAMETPREELPVIALQTDEAASWKWRDLQRQEPNYILDNQADNFAGGVEVVYPGQEREIFFWGGVCMTGTSEPGKRRKIGLLVKSADDGAITVEKRLGELEDFSPFNQGNLDAYVEHGVVSVPDGNGGQTEARIITLDYAKTRKPVTVEAARLGDARLLVEAEGIDRCETTDGGVREYDTDLRKRYIHQGADGSRFVIAEEKQILTGDGTNGARATMSMIVFTHIDMVHGVYGWFDATWLDDMPLRPFFAGEDTGKKVKWHHRVGSARGVTTTHLFEQAAPSGSLNDYAVITNHAPLQRLVTYSPLNNPGVPGFLDGGIVHYCHNIWNLPRWRIDDVPMTPAVNTADIFNNPQTRYKHYVFMPPYWSAAPENDIGLWLQGTTWKHGTKRKQETLIKSGFTNFNLFPLPTKDIGVWPHYRNLCQGFPGDYLVSEYVMESSRSLGGILFCEGMKYTGFAFGNGEFFYTVEIDRSDGGATYPVYAGSPGMEWLPYCTGRDDATISVE